MRTKCYHKKTVTGAFIGLFLVILLGFMLSVEFTFAGEPPIRPTLTPSIRHNSLSCGFIELRVEPLEEGLWTEIEWKNEKGKWEDVNGWQGFFTDENNVFWCVGENDLGAYWYRWKIYDQQGGVLIETSKTFQLPKSVGETTLIEVTLPQLK